MQIDTDGLSEADFRTMALKLEAARAMLAALKAMWLAYGENMERNGMDGADTWSNQDHEDWQRTAPDARAAIAQAEAAGITAEE